MSAATCRRCGGTGTLPIFPVTFCSCEAGRAYEAEAEMAAAQERQERNWTAAKVPARFDGYSFGTHPDRRTAMDLRSWVASGAVENLLITGPVGTGKTGLAVSILRERLERDMGPVGQFVSVPQMLDTMRPDSDSNPMRDLQRTPFLVLDDLGAERSSPWVQERLYVLINARYEAVLPTVATSNASLAQLQLALGQRTVSRLAEHLKVVPLIGADRRAS